MPTSEKAAFSYPPDFVVRVKEVFPNSVELHELLDQNVIGAGRQLDDSCLSGIDPQRVLDALRGGLDEITKLYEEASRLVQIRELYHEWGRLYEEWCRPTA